MVGDKNFYPKLKKVVPICTRLWSIFPYILPFILFVVFLLDLSDWFVNQESVVGPSGGSPIQGKQSRIITIMAFMRSQFTFFLAASSSLHFVLKQKTMERCKKSLKLLYQNLTTSITGHIDIAPARPKRVMVAWFILALSASLHALRFLYYLFTNPDGLLYPEPKRYSVMTIPGGLFDITFGLLMFFAEAVPLFLYGTLVYLCSLLIESAAVFNKLLRKTIAQTEKPSVEIPVLFGSFDERLNGLASISRHIARALEELDSVLSGFIFVVLIGNCLLMASILSQIFVLSLFTNLMSYVMYVTILVPPVISLSLIVSVCASLHETQLESVRNWQNLVIARQTYRNEIYKSDEGEKMLTILHRTAGEHHSLTVAGTAHVTRSFGVSLVCGFVGLMCFLIERSEHYETELSVHRANSLNCSMTNNPH